MRRKAYKFIKRYYLIMEKSDIAHMHKDIENLKRDVSVIMHILSEEGELTEEAKERLEKARKTNISKYEKL